MEYHAAPPAEEAQRVAAAAAAATELWADLRKLCHALGLPHHANSVAELLNSMTRRPVDAAALRREARRVDPRRHLLPLHLLAQCCPHPRSAT